MSSKRTTKAAEVEENAVVEHVEKEAEPAQAEVITETNVDVEKQKAVTVMYVGPTIPNVVRSSTVFEGGILPDALKKCIDKAPYMKKLFIPLDQLKEAIKELGKQNSALSTLYEMVKKEF